MDRRQFLTQSGIGVAALAAGGAAGAVVGGTEADAQARPRERDRRERADYSGDGHGSQRVWWSLRTDQRVVALTFDDGPHAELTPRVLAVLAEHRVRATFFMIGENAIAHRSLVADVVGAGHEVANHTWSHGRVVEEDRASVHRDILRGAHAVHAASGRRTRWLRPPRGMVDGDVLSGAAAAGNELVLWSVTRGGPTVRGSAAVLRHLVGHLHPGAIIDLHDGTGTHPTDHDLIERRHEELAILPAFLTRSIAAGYRFLTVSELLATPVRAHPRGSEPAAPVGAHSTVAGD